MSKGSKRRPSDTPEDQVAENWERIFAQTGKSRQKEPACGPDDNGETNQERPANAEAER